MLLTWQLLFRGWRFCSAKECRAFFGTKSAIQLFKTSICPLFIWLGKSTVCIKKSNAKFSCQAILMWNLCMYIVHLQTDQVHIKQLFHWRAHQQKQGCHSRHQRQVRISPPHFLFSQPIFFFLRPPAPTYPSAASSGRRNSISISSSTNMASMSSNTSSSMAATSSRRRHVSMSSTASYGTPAASRGLPFYWTWILNTSKHLPANCQYPAKIKRC